MHDAAAQTLLAWQAFHNGNFDAARRQAEQSVRIDPDDAQVLHLLGVLALRENDYPKAIERLQQTRSLVPGDASVIVSLARARAGNGELVWANELFDEAIEHSPENADAHAGKGVVLQMSEQYEASIRCYKRALTLRPLDITVLANLAAVYKRCKQFDNCIETYRRSVSAAPDAFELWLKLAGALLERGRVDESTQCYQSAATLNPRSPAVLRPLVFTAMRASKPHVAVQAAKDFSRLAPNSIAAALDMSSASLAIGDPHTALTQADRALAFTPGHRVALSNKAIAAHELGLFDVSRYLVDLKKLLQTRVLTAPPDYPNLRAFNLELVAHIENHPTLEFDVDSLSCHGGRTSGELLVEPKGPIGNLEQMIRAAVHDYVEALPTSAAHPFINSRPEEFSMTAWATILETSGHQTGHIHASAWLSGVYYVSLPGDMNATDETYAGWLEVGRPPAHYQNCTAPEIRRICPTEGRIVLFPSYFYHRTIPVQSQQRRVSIAFDFRPNQKDTQRSSERP